MSGFCDIGMETFYGLLQYLETLFISFFLKLILRFFYTILYKPNTVVGGGGGIYMSGTLEAFLLSAFNIIAHNL